MAVKVQRQIPSRLQGLYRPHRYKAIYGGRGSAKSHSVADYLVTRARKQRTRWLCAREIQRSLSTSVHQLLVDKIEEQKAQSEFHVTRDGIRGPHGSHFLFAGLKTNPDSVKSMEDLDGAWVEEADRMSQASLDLLLPTVRKPGSEVIFTWNRRSVNDPVDQLFLGGTPPPNSFVQEVNWRDNPFFPKVLFDEMMWMKGRDRDKWLHVWEGQPLRRTDALVFTNWRVDEIDDLLLPGMRPRYGCDWGFSIDPTILVGVFPFPEKRLIYVRHEVAKVKCIVEETPALFAGNDDRVPPQWDNKWGHAGLPNARRTRIVADSANPQMIRYMTDRGFNMTKAIKGAGSVEAGVSFMQNYDIVVHPSCKHSEIEMGSYQYKLDPHTEEVTSELKDKDNHVIDSIRYAIEDLRRNRGRPAPVGAPPGVLGPGLVEG
ncbi:terminase large subunit [Ruegeria phage Tedan]|nr:terminase large subunit [Ruegeria phage Tedan]